MYPLLLEPKLAPALWGGNELVTQYGKTGDPQAKIGESWECWDQNKIRNGNYAGQTVAQLRETLGHKLLGSLDPSHIFPILTKIIAAHDWLSVQVHPGDEYAQRVENQPNGKTECWYVLHAAPDAQLVLGWTRNTDRAEYERRVADGTLGEILRRVPVSAGDVFYLPAGLLHAIGAGIVLFETQQASDLTYRIFDWNRVDASGKPRELHVQKAADVLDYSASQDGALEHLSYALDGFQRTALVADSHFTVERVLATETGAVMNPHGRPLVLMALEDPLTITLGSEQTALPPYQTTLIAAEDAGVTIAAAGGSSPFLAVAPAPPKETLVKRFHDAGLAQNAIDSFLAQFHAR